MPRKIKYMEIGKRHDFIYMDTWKNEIHGDRKWNRHWDKWQNELLSRYIISIEFCCSNEKALDIDVFTIAPQFMM